MEKATIIAASIGAFTTILGIWISHFLTKSYYERKRKDELDDRAFNRRAAIHDKRIQEAREYADTLHDLFHSTGKLITILLSIGEITSSDIADIQELANHLADLRDKIRKQFLHIRVFDDTELESLHDRIFSVSNKYNDYLRQTTDTILRGGRSKIDMEKLEEVEFYYTIGEADIMNLKFKLDELAKAVK